MQAIKIKNLSKTYSNGKAAVKQINVSLGVGEVFGFLGPNGAGKTTTIKMLMGMLEPSEGHCLVYDIDPMDNPEKIHRLAGIVTERAQMYDNLTGLENVIFYSSLFGMKQRESKKQAVELLKQLQLEEAMNMKLSSYSTGMRQRLSLARALIHKPKVLFLDEPTSGLDPQSAHDVNALIHNLAKERGTTVFLCTHQLRYAQEVCTRYGLMNNGELFAKGTYEELAGKVYKGLTMKIQSSCVPGNIGFEKIGENYYTKCISSEQEIPQIIRQVVEIGGNIYHVSTEKPTLEEIYFKLVQNQKDKE